MSWVIHICRYEEKPEPWPPHACSGCAKSGNKCMVHRAEGAIKHFANSINHGENAETVSAGTIVLFCNAFVQKEEVAK